jgi:mono/diheme cytochrome c family protein
MNSALKRSLLVAIIAVAGALLFDSAAHAQASDPADIAAGARLFRQKGNCQACHG